MSDEETSGPTEMELLRQRVESMSRLVPDLHDRVEELEAEVAELKELVDPDPGNVAYQQLTKSQKVHRVRKALLEAATRQGGTASMKYKEVMALFNNKPSPGHAYDLMEAAAVGMEGYTYDAAGQGRGDKRIRVDADAVNDDRLFHAVNNTETASAV